MKKAIAILLALILIFGMVSYSLAEKPDPNEERIDGEQLVEGTNTYTLESGNQITFTLVGDNTITNGFSQTISSVEVVGGNGSQVYEGTYNPVTNGYDYGEMQCPLNGGGQIPAFSHIDTRLGTSTPTPIIEESPTPVVEITPTPIVEITPTPRVEITPTSYRTFNPTPTPEVKKHCVFYVVEGVYDGVVDDTKTRVIWAKEGLFVQPSDIDWTIYNKIGYIFSYLTNCPLTVVYDVEQNFIHLYYISNNQG